MLQITIFFPRVFISRRFLFRVRLRTTKTIGINRAMKLLMFLCVLLLITNAIRNLSSNLRHQV
jgi:hypothetical protein